MGTRMNKRGSLSIAVDRSAPAVYPDQRQHVRLECDNVLDILPCAAREPWKFQRVELTDCSGDGVGIVTPFEMACGEQFLAKLLLGGSVALLLYTVRHCRRQESGLYKIGANLKGFMGGGVGAGGAPDRVLTSLIEERLV